MSVEQLARKAIQNKVLDREAQGKIRSFLHRAGYLTAEEYETLRTLSRALRAGEVVRAEA